MNWDYIACFIDTDGFLGIKEDNRGYKHVKIAFGNTNSKVLKTIKRFLKAKNKIMLMKKGKTTLGKKNFYILEIAAYKDCKHILEHVVDKMIIKKERAEKCLEYIMTNPPKVKPRKKGKLFRCSKCKRYLSKNEFAKNKCDDYGITNYCKECSNAYYREHYKNVMGRDM